MGFPTVRSDPWKKGKRPNRVKLLWSADFWKQLVRKAEKELWRVDLTPQVRAMITLMNLTLYGSDTHL